MAKARRRTTTAKVVDDDATLRQEIGRIEGETDVDKLIRELLACVALTVRQLILLGVYIRQLEVLGADVLSLPVPNMGLFRRIAHGQLLPEVFIDLIGAPRLLKKVSLLSLPDQRKVGSGTPLQVLVSGSAQLLIAPKDMTSTQVRQVFAHGSIRSKSQQAAWLADQQQRAATKKQPKSEVTVDSKRGGIHVVGTRFINVSELTGYLAQLATK